jgi:hypothetical protein
VLHGKRAKYVLHQRLYNELYALGTTACKGHHLATLRYYWAGPSLA